MITIKLSRGSLIELDDKKAIVSLDKDSINLAEESYRSPGEYEAKNIELVYGQSAALIVWEKLQIVYVFSLNPPSNFEKSQFSSCDVLIFNTDEKIDKSKATTILDVYEPRAVIFSSKAEIEDS